MINKTFCDYFGHSIFFPLLLFSRRGECAELAQFCLKILFILFYFQIYLSIPPIPFISHFHLTLLCTAHLLLYLTFDFYVKSQLLSSQFNYQRFGTTSQFLPAQFCLPPSIFIPLTYLDFN